jgi:cytidyltransferase-like protein
MHKVMVFGTFDGIHEGHRHLFREAKRHGDHLIAVVAPDQIVHDLKGKMPRHHVGDRMEFLMAEPDVDRVVMGDDELGSWNVIHRHRPHVVAIGYDQERLLTDLQGHVGMLRWPLEIVTLSPYKPEQYHTRILRDIERK